MRSEIKIIITLVVALLAAVFVCGALYTHRVDEWRQVARKELKEALHEPVEKVDFEHSHYLRTDSIEDDSFVNVVVQTEKEKNVYSHFRLKGGQNVEESSSLRAIHSVLYMEGLLSVDSLEKSWTVRLLECLFPGTGYLQMAVSGATDSVMSSRYGTPAALAKADSLTYYTMGYVDEIKVTGWVSLVPWQVYSVNDWLWIIFLAVLVGTLCMLWLEHDAVIARLRKKFSLIERVPVRVVSDSHVHYYELEDGTFFDREQRILRKGNQTTVLSVQNTLLLVALIEAEGNALSVAKLFKELWPDDSGNDEKLRKAVARLRKELHKVSSYTIENELGIYRLKLIDYPADEAKNK